MVALSVYGGRDYLDKSQEQSLSFTPRGGTGEQNFNTAVGDLTDWGNRGLSGRWGRQWGSGLTSSLLAAYSEYTSDYGRDTRVTISNPATADSALTRELRSTEDNFLTDLTLRADNEWRPAPAHELRFGAWFSATDAEYRHVRNDSATILDLNQSSSRAAAYAQDTWDVTDGLSLTAGGRISYDQVAAKSYLEPRASARLALTDRLTLKAAAGRYHQFVNRVVNENVTEGSRDFWLLADGDLVDVTRSDHLVAGVAYETDSYLFDVELYRKETTGLSEFSLRFRRNDIDPLNLFFAGQGRLKARSSSPRRSSAPSRAGCPTRWPRRATRSQI